MSLTQIEFPSYETTRTAATMASKSGNIVEKTMESGDIMFAEIVRDENGKKSAGIKAYWSPGRNYGVVYETIIPSK